MMAVFQSVMSVPSVRRMKTCGSPPGTSASSSGRALPAHFEVVEQVSGRLGHGRDSLLERLCVMAGRGAESADLPYVLERGGTHIGVGRVLGVRLAEGLDAAAHNRDVTPAGYCGANRIVISPCPVTVPYGSSKSTVNRPSVGTGWPAHTDTGRSPPRPAQAALACSPAYLTRGSSSSPARQRRARPARAGSAAAAGDGGLR